jgi:glycine cleavage system H protein
MPDISNDSTNLELRLDKFIFQVAADRLYSDEGVWVKLEGYCVRIGLSDFLQQRSGDVAFAEVKPVETELSVGDEVAVIETIKVNIGLSSPVSGVVVAVNPLMETAPEAINQDPYGSGWLALIEAREWENDRIRLLDPPAYLARMRAEADEETRP